MASEFSEGSFGSSFQCILLLVFRELRPFHSFFYSTALKCKHQNTDQVECFRVLFEEINNLGK